jgi:hypothetical protein
MSQIFTLPDPVLHGTMDYHRENHLVVDCPFFHQHNTTDAPHPPVMGEFVTREHVRHKSGIAHRGTTRINHVRELPTRLNHFAAVGRLWGDRVRV